MILGGLGVFEEKGVSKNAVFHRFAERVRIEDGIPFCPESATALVLIYPYSLYHFFCLKVFLLLLLVSSLAVAT